MAIIKLDTSQTQQLLPLAVRAAGTYEIQTLIQGNSLLSTVYVKALGAGATVKANYWETTTGSDFGEREDLPSHDLISAASTNPSTISVTPFHNTPKLEVIVTGGTAEFSVQVTVVNSFATDLDAALKKDAQVVDIGEDKGIPIMCYDETAGLWRFIRCEDGALSIGIAVGDPFHDDGTTTATNAGNPNSLTSFSVPVGTTRKFTGLNVSACGVGFFTLTVGGSIISKGSTGPGEENIFFPFPTTYSAPAGTSVSLTYDLLTTLPSSAAVFWSLQANDFT